MHGFEFIALLGMKSFTIASLRPPPIFPFFMTGSLPILHSLQGHCLDDARLGLKGNWVPGHPALKPCS